MTEKDFEIVSSKIDEEKAYLNSISQDIWKMPELQFKEVHAHATLTSALTKYGFRVEKHYFLTTAFRAEYQSKLGMFFRKKLPILNVITYIKIIMFVTLRHHAACYSL